MDRDEAEEIDESVESDERLDESDDCVDGDDSDDQVESDDRLDDQLSYSKTAGGGEAVGKNIAMSRNMPEELEYEDDCVDRDDSRILMSSMTGVNCKNPFETAGKKVAGKDDPSALLALVL